MEVRAVCKGTCFAEQNKYLCKQLGSTLFAILQQWTCPHSRMEESTSSSRMKGSRKTDHQILLPNKSSDIHSMTCDNCNNGKGISYSTLLPHCVLRFFKITGKTCDKICIYLLRVHFKKKDQQKTYLMMFMRFFFSDFLYKNICCGYSFELHRQDAIQMGTHNTCLYKKKVDKKVHWL